MFIVGLVGSAVIAGVIAAFSPAPPESERGERPIEPETTVPVPGVDEQPVVEHEEEPEERQEQRQDAPQEQETPDYSFDQTDFRELGNGTIVVDLRLDTEARDEESLRAIGQELKEEFKYEADALFVEGEWGDMWVFIEERAVDTYPAVVESPEYRDGIAIYTEE